MTASVLPFHWRQLESPDYRTYIVNLRKVGCPERTLQDIIKADVDALYATKRHELGLADDEASPWSRRTAAQLAATLLEAPVRLTENAGAPTAGGAVVEIPLVLRKIDLAALQLEPDQLEAIARLREEFITRMSSGTRDPADPLHRERWEKTQRQVDEALIGAIGRPAYLGLESAPVAPE